MSCSYKKIFRELVSGFRLLLVAPIALGTIFHNVGNSYSSIKVRNSHGESYSTNREQDLVSSFKIMPHENQKLMFVVFNFFCFFLLGSRCNAHVCSFILDFHEYWWIPFFCRGHEGTNHYYYCNVFGSIGWIIKLWTHLTDEYMSKTWIHFSLQSWSILQLPSWAKRNFRLCLVPRKY